jgi:FixJ family two-component response regulator
MGQAKQRGSREQRIIQSQTSASERREAAHLSEARKQAEFEAHWATLSEAEQDILRVKELEREKVRRSIFGLMGASAMLASHIPVAHRHRYSR